MRIAKYLVAMIIAIPIPVLCSESFEGLEGETYVSMEQFFQANLDKRPLNSHERSYLIGTVYGVVGYVANQQMMGWSDSTLVCMNTKQRKSITPEWLHKAMIQETLRNSALHSFNSSVVVVYTLSKHFPCEDAPKYNPHGFDDPIEFTIPEHREASEG